MKKVKNLVRYAREVMKRAKKKGKPLARRILSESIKLERMMEAEAKKALNKRDTTKKKKAKKRKR